MTTHDPEIRLWREIESARKDYEANRLTLAKLFYQLRCLYSERSNCAAGRRSCDGHGTFQREILKRGFKPNRVREMINDYEVSIGLRPPAESTSAKRKARRSNSEYQRGYRDAARSKFRAIASDPVTRFAALLPFYALRSAYRAALQELHPDHGGSVDRTTELIQAWKQVEQLHTSMNMSISDHMSVH